MDATGAIRILMIDDNEPDAYLVAEALRMAHIKCELTHVKDGVGLMAALGASESAPRAADLVFLDLNLPRTDGLELLSTLRNNPSYASVPIVIMSSSVSEQDRSRALATGANCYLIKPLELNDFVEAIVGTVTKMLDLRRP